MFDGLKDRLSSFTEDVEEDIEESDEADPGDATSETATAEAAAEEGNSSPDDTSGGASADAPDDRDRSASDAVEATTDDSGADRSLTERAKLFASGKTVLDEDDLAAHLDDLEFALLASDVEMAVAEQIIDRVEATLLGETRRRLESTGDIAADALREALYDTLDIGDLDLIEAIESADEPAIVIFTGVNGVGKTTTIAKLVRYLESAGYSSVVANGDTFRAGANEQLIEHADALGVECIHHEQGSDPAAVIYDAVEYAEAHDIDVVLGDTAGRLHTSDDLMAQLEKIDRVVDPDLTLFVDEAVAGQDAVNRAREFDAAASIDGTILTKADADPQGGAAISIAQVTGCPILFLGTGQGYEDLTPFDPEQMADDLVGDQ
ncbi:MAG: signal recognition particle-docking protein FtsY [Halococcoides sp.]